MSSRASAGISQSVSSIRIGSDIEHDVPAPAVAVTVQREVVVRDRLDEVARLARASDDDRGHGVLADARVPGALPDDEVAPLVGQEPLGLGEKHELGKPLGQQRAAVGRLGLDLPLHALAGPRFGVLLEQLAQGEDGLAEDRGLAAPVQLELQLGGVLDPAVRGLHALTMWRLPPRRSGKRYGLRRAETRSAAAIGSSGRRSAPRRAARAALAPRPPTQTVRDAASPVS